MRLYTNIVFTVIAGLLALNTVRTPAAQAQAGSQYTVAVLSADYTARNHPERLQTEINGAAKGRELVALMPFDQPGRYLAVYK